ncbi:MAG: Haloacid dehalogenase superfamily enzyme, subfamily IA [Parcubacteria group bacterium GW2011_GWA2_52_8]|nr:MAG: Haloacid dehalogenase superfamily enzyme, subfamily IA [Parcubacteria group bacterium GW2011_GWA2_52_8]
MKIIMMDLMFTIVQPSENRWRLYQEVLATLGINATMEEIRRAYEKARRQGEAEEVTPGGRLPNGYYAKHWSRINSMLIGLLGYPDRASESNGLEVYGEVMGNPSRYTIAPTTLNFLKDARVRGYRLCLLTNQETVYVRRFLEAFDLLDTFQGVYISEELGYKKPDPRLFEEALTRIRIPISDIAFIGNNPRNDMEGAWRAGIDHRFLFDPRGEHAYTPTEVSYTVLRELSEVFEHF